MKKKTTLTTKIVALKYRAYELRKNYQIPYLLMLYIEHINDNTTQKEVVVLMNLTEHLLRVKGYYKKYPLIEKDCSIEIKKAIDEVRKETSN